MDCVSTTAITNSISGDDMGSITSNTTTEHDTAAASTTTTMSNTTANASSPQPIQTVYRKCTAGCSRPAENGKKSCRYHLDKFKETAARRKAQGICSSCREPIDTKVSVRLCRKHLEAERKSKQRRYQMLRQTKKTVDIMLSYNGPGRSRIPFGSYKN
ncbi:hypothetical protein M434DRAFT_36179 [Hypoxylon sp. CO27-5]|nr:hypothetical protein M434DRAFT_36179 [Hypoxylon sp. CO27-5]